MGSVCETERSLNNLTVERKKFRDRKLRMLRSEGYKLSSMSSITKNDREMVEAAVSVYGYSIKFASLKLKNDYDIGMAAVFSYGPALRYLSDKLRKNKEIVKCAINNMAFSLVFSDPSLHTNKPLTDLAASRGFDIKDNNGIKIFPSDECVLCISEKASVVLLPCGHMPICTNNACYTPFNEKTILCPICRGMIYSCVDLKTITEKSFSIHL